MKIIKETERFIVREMHEGDTEGMLQLDSDVRVHEYLGKKTISKEEEALQQIQKVMDQYEDKGIGRWAIEWKANGEFVGWTGLKYESSFGPLEEFIDLGYRLRPEYWRMGIGLESAIFSRDYAFETLQAKDIYASSHVDNAGSIYILEKIGFEWQEHFFYEDLKCNWYKMSR